MNSPVLDSNANSARHASPPLGIVALVYMVLFLAGLFPVTTFGGLPHFPGPWESPDVIAAFFAARPQSAVICAFLQFSAAIPLGIFTASIVSRLQFLGVRAAGVHIAAFGGWMTAFNIAASSCVLWAMTHPGVAQDTALINALYFLAYALGGPGFSVPFGLLLAGISIPAAFMRLLPVWLIVPGLILAVMGELSALNLVFPEALPLIPLTRFPGFVWLIVAGFLMPRSNNRRSSTVQNEPGT
jgi:hypothetical protein